VADLVGEIAAHAGIGEVEADVSGVEEGERDSAVDDGSPGGFSYSS
jgi:hypothetical protein